MKSTVKFHNIVDDNKNWIKIIKTIDGLKLYKWIREIIYH